MTTTAKFPLGRLVITANAQDKLLPEDVQSALSRHAKGDWGELCNQDRQENEMALVQHLRLFSVYRDGLGTKFYVITEHSRDITTVLLPEDY